MNKSEKFSPEVRERAVRMVQEHRGEYPSLWAAVNSIPPNIGCVPQTILEWVKRCEVDSGARSGLTSAELKTIHCVLASPHFSYPSERRRFLIHGHGLASA